jgi:calcium-binding protein CML
MSQIHSGNNFSGLGAQPMSGGPLHKRGVVGTSFTSDFTSQGADRAQNQIFTGKSEGILEEERRLIEKVFSIVDNDNSGTIDVKELEEMFRIFGIDTHFLSTAVNRIMANVDQDHDGSISPQEFYKLLSQKFEKGDLRSEILDVFRRMDKKRDGFIDVDELHEVSVMLGESMTKEEIKDMINNFRDLLDKRPSADGKQPDKSKFKEKSPSQIDMNPKLSPDDFYEVMQEDL